jgi:hypothetical protein
MKKNSHCGEMAIIYFCFNRLDHTIKSLPKIIDNRGNIPIFIFCDESKIQNDSKTKEVRHFVMQKTFGLNNCEVIFRKENFGLAKNVISGVNQVFSQGFETVTVLEDDCVPGSNYFKYMEKALFYYKGFNNVMHISGFGMPLKNKPKRDTYITPYPCSWGWSTWKSKWQSCNFEDNDYYKKLLSDLHLVNLFNWSGKSFSYFLTLQLKGEVNSWLIRWYAHIFKNQGVCVWATNSKLNNIGFDGTGQHRVKRDLYNQKELIIADDFDFEDELSCFNPSIIKQFRQFFMGPKLIDKIKTVIYLNTGILFEKINDVSSYYNNKKC